MSGLDFAPRRLLAVVAHPDDAEFYAGGWLARIIAAKTEVHFAILTDGQGGSMDPNATRASVAAVRRREQEAAADVLGVSSVTFLGEEDGRLFDTWPLRVAIAKLIRTHRPDALLTTDPQPFYYEEWPQHPDHRAAGALTLAAAMPLANVRHAAEELDELEPHTVSHIVLAAPAAPRTFAVLEKAHFEKKLLALRAHESQMSGPTLERFMRGRAEAAAAQARSAGLEASLAEPFILLTLLR